MMRAEDKTPVASSPTQTGGRRRSMRNAGTVQHMDAHTHLPESLSKTPFEVIAVELKR